jgi:hypothetical protein
MAVTRKLAAILAADIVGYSRLAGSDEERTLARLRALRSDLQHGRHGIGSWCSSEREAQANFLRGMLLPGTGAYRWCHEWPSPTTASCSVRRRKSHPRVEQRDDQKGRLRLRRHSFFYARSPSPSSRTQSWHPRTTPMATPPRRDSAPRSRCRPRTGQRSPSACRSEVSGYRAADGSRCLHKASMSPLWSQTTW